MRLKYAENLRNSRLKSKSTVSYKEKSVIWKELPVLWLIPEFPQIMVLWLQIFPSEADFHLEGLFGKYLTVLWFLNESFDNWPTYSYFQIFCLFYIMSLINFERVWAKKYRNLRFYFCYYLLTAVRIFFILPIKLRCTAIKTKRPTRLIHIAVHCRSTGLFFGGFFIFIL